MIAPLLTELQDLLDALEFAHDRGQIAGKLERQAVAALLAAVQALEPVAEAAERAPPPVEARVFSQGRGAASSFNGSFSGRRPAVHADDDEE